MNDRRRGEDDDIDGLCDGDDYPADIAAGLVTESSNLVDHNEEIEEDGKEHRRDEDDDHEDADVYANDRKHAERYL